MERGSAKLPDIVELVSDPEHRLLVKDAGDIFVTKMEDNYMNQTYEMVQPALVLIDIASGKTVPELTWSWKTMDLGLEEWSEVMPDVRLVSYRPVISDLRAAIRERRPVKLASTQSTAEILVEANLYGDVEKTADS
mmetsp:Transcript_32707/g.89541  ORF Transcript_32707/g.89541 Transcript_32707/m.89541 type:complete len:136 (+) Transcript_32707:327-734(+)